jgi:hypothetical protein
VRIESGHQLGKTLDAKPVAGYLFVTWQHKGKENL